MPPSRSLALLTAAALYGSSTLLAPLAAFADDPVLDPTVVTPPPATGTGGGSGTFFVPPAPMVPPITLTLTSEEGLPSGAPGVVALRALDAVGNPTGGFAILIVHFPLAPDNSAYWTDLVLLVPIFEDGTGTATITIPAAVPAGVPIRIEAHAILPPHTAVAELKTVVR
ncbi:MAG: hypothetical protein KatS3mg061_1483 [Dehalococcoidia bacterium]|nr:MAG: hypothetical protein KatS3mg061_1483 [Dehalococcoidia bacterium]